MLQTAATRLQREFGLFSHLAGNHAITWSGGSEPGTEINPAAIEAMAEVGIDITAQAPKILTPDAVQSSDVVITMGCSDTCPVFPEISYRDWDLPDPAGKSADAVRPIRDEIRARVEALIAELLPAHA